MWQRNLCLLTVIMAPELFAASAAIVTLGDTYCQTVRIPGGWRVYDYDKLSDFRLGTEYEFRKAYPDTDRYLIAAVSSKARGMATPEDYSVNKYWVSFRNSQVVRGATEQEWESAQIAPITGQLQDAAFAERQQGEYYVYGQKAFRKSGPMWPAPGDDARISADGRWIAVQSLQGPYYRKGEGILPRLAGPVPGGRFFIDLYNIASGERLISLDGIDRDFRMADAPLHSTVWLDSRYFIVPLGMFRAKFLVCAVPGGR
jgi:hypothetical protein